MFIIFCAKYVLRHNKVNKPSCKGGAEGVVP